MGRGLGPSPAQLTVRSELQRRTTCPGIWHPPSAGGTGCLVAAHDPRCAAGNLGAEVNCILCTVGGRKGQYFCFHDAPEAGNLRAAFREWLERSEEAHMVDPALVVFLEFLIAQAEAQAEELSAQGELFTLLLGGGEVLSSGGSEGGSEEPAPRTEDGPSSS